MKYIILINIVNPIDLKQLNYLMIIKNILKKIQ